MRQWINLVEHFESHFEGVLYHACAGSSADSCIEQGVRSPSYWAIGEINEYYLGVLDDEGDEAVCLEANIGDFDESLLEPDYPGLEEPVCGRQEDEIWSEWEASEKTWRDSLRIIGSVRYRGVIKPRLSDGF